MLFWSDTMSAVPHNGVVGGAGTGCAQDSRGDRVTAGASELPKRSRLKSACEHAR